MFVDATYKITSNLKEKHMQLLSILIKIDTKPDKAIPCVWALMKQKQTADYIKIFSFLKSKLQYLQPFTFMADYEKALSNAAEIVFPGIQIYHCYFHYSQALIRKAQNMSLTNRVINKDKYPERYRILKRQILLALLPAKYIEPIFA
ncbi:uncharacterized protein [Prorops nasuta]|uniref:uncharacterized protein n=1 Tax=Prorops nasuta TaxID=863751 RepID=UPI0034CE007E